MPAWIVLGSLAALLLVLARGSVKPATAFTALAVTYVLTGVVDTDAMLGNYANPALITLILLLLVSLALERSHLLDGVSERLLSGSEGVAPAFATAPSDPASTAMKTSAGLWPALASSMMVFARSLEASRRWLVVKSG